MTGRQNGADTVSTQLGECLKAARQARKLTLKQVAERTGLSLSTLSKVENHQMSLTYDKLLQLTNGLGIAIAELFHSAADSPDRTPDGDGAPQHQPREGRRRHRHAHLFLCL